MHIADIVSNNLGANGVVGGGFPLAVGRALTIRMKKEKRMRYACSATGPPTRAISMKH
jgi:pyruvate dehydrogenase E1 component alpha subunit